MLVGCKRCCGNPAQKSCVVFFFPLLWWRGLLVMEILEIATLKAAQKAPQTAVPLA